jgi:hypothetical protein
MADNGRPGKTHGWTVKRSRVPVKKSALFEILASLKLPGAASETKVCDECNDPTVNALFIPAAILNPPFFDKSYPVARNGAVGWILGQEVRAVTLLY